MPLLELDLKTLFQSLDFETFSSPCTIFILQMLHTQEVLHKDISQNSPLKIFWDCHLFLFRYVLGTSLKFPEMFYLKQHLRKNYGTRGSLQIQCRRNAVNVRT